MLSHMLWVLKSEATNLRRNWAKTGYYLRRRQLVERTYTNRDTSHQESTDDERLSFSVGVKSVY